MSDKVHSAIFYNVVQLVPAEDWGAIYEFDDGKSDWNPVDWIGLANVIEKVFRNGKEVQSLNHHNDVVGVEIDSDGCFGVSQECTNCVRLIRRHEWEAEQKNGTDDN